MRSAARHTECVESLGVRGPDGMSRREGSCPERPWLLDQPGRQPDGQLHRGKRGLIEWPQEARCQPFGRPPGSHASLPVRASRCSLLPGPHPTVQPAAGLRLDRVLVSMSFGLCVCDGSRTCDGGTVAGFGMDNMLGIFSMSFGLCVCVMAAALAIGGRSWASEWTPRVDSGFSSKGRCQSLREHLCAQVAFRSGGGVAWACRTHAGVLLCRFALSFVGHSSHAILVASAAPPSH